MAIVAIWRRSLPWVRSSAATTTAGTPNWVSVVTPAIVPIASFAGVPSADVALSRSAGVRPDFAIRYPNPR